MMHGTAFRCPSKTEVNTAPWVSGRFIARERHLITCGTVLEWKKSCEQNVIDAKLGIMHMDYCTGASTSEVRFLFSHWRAVL